MPADADTIRTVATILALGAGLGTFTWKAFEMVEGAITADTKLEIAIWLLGIEISPKLTSLVSG
jgi:hypothetical protein